MKKNYSNLLKIVKKMRFDLHDASSTKVAIALSFFTLFILAILVRRSMIGFDNADYQIFASWYDYVKAHGISSFNTDFSNYNPPYTYFLYLITLIPIDKMITIKGLMLVFDILLAYSVYLVIKYIKPGKYLPISAALGTMFLPTVLFTGALWGQFDQLYTAFIVFSLYYLLKNDSKRTWIFFGIAIAIKLQAIFFLPVLLIMMFKRIKWWDSIYGLIAFGILTFLPLLAGRSISSILNIYSAQASLFKGNLTLFAPNIYEWIPNRDFDYINNAGIYLTVAVMAGFMIYSLANRKFSDKDTVILSALMLLLVPFLLPQMHERYLFPATIGIFISALYIPKLTWIAVTIQLTTIFSYMSFLFGKEPPIPLDVVAIIGVVMIGTLIYTYKESDATNLKLVPKINL